MNIVDESTKHLGAAYDLYLLRDFSKLLTGLITIILWIFLVIHRRFIFFPSHFEPALMSIREWKFFIGFILLCVSYLLGTLLQEIFSDIKLFKLEPEINAIKEKYKNYYIIQSEIAFRFPYSVRPLERIVVSKHFQASIGIILANIFLIAATNIIILGTHVKHFDNRFLLYLISYAILLILSPFGIYLSKKICDKKISEQEEFIIFYFEELEKIKNNVFTI